MALVKVTYVNGETVIGADNLNAIQDNVILNAANIATNAGNIADSAADITALQSGKVDKVTGKGLSTNDFTNADKTKLDGIEAQATRVLIDNTLAQSGQAADAKAAGDAISSLDSAVEMVEAQVNNLGAATFSPLNFVSDGSGSINATTGGITSGDVYRHTDYVDLSGYERIQYNRIGTTSSSATSGMAFYDENKEYIDGYKMLTSQTEAGYVGAHTLNVPSGAKYARFTLYLDVETMGEFWVNGEYALVYKTNDLRPSPSQVLMNEILVPDFGPTSVSNRTIYKRGNSVYLRKSANSTTSYTFSISGDEMRVQSVANYSAHVPNIGNLIPISKANSLRFSIQNKPTVDPSSYASYVEFTFYTVEGEGDEAVITRVANRAARFDNILDKTCVVDPPPSNATHFEIVIYSRRANYLPSDSYCRFTFDMDCETGEDDRLNGIRGMISDDVETTGVASKSYAVGDLLAWGNDLYVATAAIASGEALVVDTNIAATTISAQLAALKSLINS